MDNPRGTSNSFHTFKNPAYRNSSSQSFATTSTSSQDDSETNEPELNGIKMAEVAASESLINGVPNGSLPVVSA